MATHDPEQEEYLRSVIAFQAEHIKEQAKRIHTAAEMLEELSIEIDEDNLLTRIEEITKVLLYGV